MGGSRDFRRACGGLLKPVGTSLAVFSRLCKNGGALGLVPGFYERRRMNTYVHKNRGNVAMLGAKVATLGSNVATFQNVEVSTLRRWDPTSPNVATFSRVL